MSGVSTLGSIYNTVIPYLSFNSWKEVGTTIDKVSKAATEFFKTHKQEAILTALGLIGYYFAPFTLPVSILSGVVIGYSVAKAKYEKLCKEYSTEKSINENHPPSNPKTDPESDPAAINSEVALHAALTGLQLFSPVFSMVFTAIHGALIGCKAGKAWLVHGEVLLQEASKIDINDTYFSPIHWKTEHSDVNKRDWLQERL